ncbi:MAG TPA: hypothetical protein V6D33_11850 [Cyanophyceae cyanobacterium]
MSAKTDWLRMRLTPEQKQKLDSHAIARGTTVTAVVEELINALPEDIKGIPVAKIIYEVKS